MMFGRVLGVPGDRLHAIAAIALPIVGGMISQNILNIVDTLMVSRLGAAHVAGVGMASFVHWLSVSFVAGMAAGVQAMAARRKGEGKDAETAVPLNGALLLVIGFAIPVSIALILAAPTFIPLLNKDPQVGEIGSGYLQVRLIAMVAVGCNFAFRGYWNAVNLAKLYFQTLIMMHALNIVLNYAFIFGELGAPQMGATGAALGTALSTYAGLAYYVYLGMRHAGKSGFMRRLPSAASMKTLVRLSIPGGLQQLFFSAGFVALFAIIGALGMTPEDAKNATAGANVLIQITLVAILPGLGFGLAAASLVGQALGRGDKVDAHRWGWDVVKVAFVIMAVFGLPMAIFARPILAGFFPEDPAALQMALAPLRLVGVTICFDAAGMVLMNALIGAGATRTVMAISMITQWLIFLPVAYVLAFVFHYGLFEIWCAQVSYRMLFAGIVIWIWQKRRWADITM